MTTGSVLFVHGSGNRAAAAKEYGAKIASNLKVTKGHMHLSTWGDSVGPDPAFPRLAETMPIVQKAFPDTTQEVLADPYGPLRDMAGGGAQGAFGDPGKEDARAVLGLMRFGGVLDLSETQLTAEQLAAAATEVAESPEFAAAGGDPIALIDAAVTATAARAVQRQGPDVVSGAFGFDINLDPIGKVKEALSKAVMGGVGIIGNTVGELGGPIARWLSEQFAKRRTPLMQQHILVAADVLFYQRHSAAIRAHVRKEIKALKPPRLILGHSLGGIILVDTLFGEDAEPIDVKLLVTFGSQSPLLQALEAFGTVKPDGVPWLNIWTQYDFVSFLGGGLWPGKVTDAEITVDVGFPEAHGAYYDSKAFYDRIRAHPAAKAVLT
ncbi:MAG TPA: hypothetical protein VFO05_08495 [Candidatus Limnocylindrales bacterium]|nr:hypothetical protein [Candidatus Limnocylindrales bacterium]